MQHDGNRQHAKEKDSNNNNKNHRHEIEKFSAIPIWGVGWLKGLLFQTHNIRESHAFGRCETVESIRIIAIYILVEKKNILHWALYHHLRVVEPNHEPNGRIKIAYIFI